MHHISIGRAHKGQAVILLIDDLNIRVIATDTGELLRAFELDPNVGYQPRFKTKKPPEPGVQGAPMSSDITLVAGAGFEPATFGL